MKSLRYFLLALLGITGLCILWYLFQFPYTIAPFINPILMMLFGLAGGLLVARKLKAEWRLYGMGAATFIASQVIHIPFNLWFLVPYLDSFGLSGNTRGTPLIVFVLVVGLSAGVFEESARYIVYTRWLSSVRSWKDGLMYGAGHGGAEAIITGVVVLAFFLQMLTLQGGLEGLGIPADQLERTQATVDTYWGTPWYIFILAAVERLAAITFHMAAALLVLRSVKSSNILWFFGAILAHTLFNAIALYANVAWGTVAAEGLIVLMALGFAGLIFWLREEDEPFAEFKQEGSSNLQSPAPDAPAITAESLEDSRYDG